MVDDDVERQRTWREFSGAVNMTASELDEWLDGEDSKAAGQKSDGGGESTGHESGRHIAKILEKKKPDLSHGDYEQMRKWSVTSNAISRNGRRGTSRTRSGAIR